MQTISQPSDSHRYEAEGLLRLGAAGVLIDALVLGHWTPDGPTLEAIAELVDLAARSFDLAAWLRPEVRAA